MRNDKNGKEASEETALIQQFQRRLIEIQQDALGKINRLKEILEMKKGRLIPYNIKFVRKSRKEGVKGRGRGVVGRVGRQKEGKG